MNEFSEFIENKLALKGISKTNFAKVIKVSRLALYRLLESPEKAKFSTITKIIRALDVRFQEAENILLFRSEEASYNVRLAKENLNIEDSRLADIIGMPLNDINSILEDGNITFKQVNFFSNSTGIPFELFLSDKDEFEDKLSTYLIHKSRIDNSRLLSEYFQAITQVQIDIYNIISQLPDFNLDYDSSEDIEYFEEMSVETGVPIANVHISILGLKNNKPIVIASNLPKDRLYVEHFVESIFNKVKSKFLANLETHEIIWVCNTFTSKNVENRTSSLVKFSNDFSKADFFQLYNYLDRNAKPKPQEILSFLSYNL